eukprot:gene5161-22783_t
MPFVSLSKTGTELIFIEKVNARSLFKTIKWNQTASLPKKIVETFNHLDKDGSGTLTENDFSSNANHASLWNHLCVALKLRTDSAVIDFSTFVRALKALVMSPTPELQSIFDASWQKHAPVAQAPSGFQHIQHLSGEQEHHGIEGQKEYLYNKTHGGRQNNDGRTLNKYVNVASTYLEVALDYQLDQIMMWYHGEHVGSAGNVPPSSSAVASWMIAQDHGDVVAVLPISEANQAADDFSHNVGLWAEIKSKLDDDHSGEIDNNEWTTGLTRVAMELSAGEISKHFKGRQVFTKRPLNILEFYKELEVASNVALQLTLLQSTRPATVMESAAVVLSDTRNLMYIAAAAVAIGIFINLAKK